MQKTTLPTILFALSASALLACGASAELEISGEIAVGETCTESYECVPGSMCFNEFCVGEGNLRTSLSFFDDTDLDLHLVTPNGVEINFINSTGDGGELDVDQCITSCGEDVAHVENIVFAGAPPLGTYEVWVENYDGRAAVNFEIEIVGDGISTSFQGSVGAIAGGESEHLTFDF